MSGRRPGGAAKEYAMLRSAPRGAFALVEMLTTLAALFILLGLVVELARYVRHRSAEALTGDLLAMLESMLDQNPDLERALAAAPPLVKPWMPRVDEPDLQAAAMANNRAFVRICQGRAGDSALSRIPLSLYDRVTLRDGWGTPIAYVASGASNIGMSPRKRRFFMSAGPDRRFSTVLDNVYSYEQVLAARPGRLPKQSDIPAGVR